MSWYNNNKTLTEAVDTIISNIKVNPCSLGIQARKVLMAERALFKARKSCESMHCTKSQRSKHMACAEDFERQKMILFRMCEIYTNK